MNIDSRAVIPLKVMLLGVFSVLVVLQGLALYAGVANLDAPDGKPAGWALVSIFVLLALCAEVVLVATWRLLDLVRNGRIFSDAAFRWVDTIAGAIGSAWLILGCVFLLVAYHADDPGMPVVIFVTTVAVGAMGLLVLVMRSLLRRAVRLRSEMDGVI